MTEKELAEATLDLVHLRELKSRKKEIRSEARLAVERAMDDGDTPISIARKTGLPLKTVTKWMVFNRHLEEKA